MKVIVIGGGPAGMMAAIASAKMGNQVTLIEKKERVGRKLLITGKGRCNITSSIDMSEFISNVPGNGRFLYSAFQNYTNQDIIAFLQEQNVLVKEERGNRIFPESDKSADVVNAFINQLKKLKVQIKLNTRVIEIRQEEEKVTGVYCEEEKENRYFLPAEKVIVATGGKSYPQTGSTGDGYALAKKLGHTITKVKPSLVPLTVEEDKIKEIEEIRSTYGTSLELCKSLQGLSLKNVAISIKDTKKQKVIYEDFGEMLFTHFGVSGPIILSASAHLLRYLKIEELLEDGKIQLNIDLKPALSEEKLDDRIIRDFETEKNKLFKNSLVHLLPQKLIEPIILLSKIPENKMVNEITKQERLRLVKLLKEFKVTIQGFRPIEEGIVTAGGINIKEINPKTMESKIIAGLYFAGEIIDVDAYTGGFNLQIAYSTGYTAGIN